MAKGFRQTKGQNKALPRAGPFLAHQGLNGVLLGGLFCNNSYLLCIVFWVQFNKVHENVLHRGLATAALCQLGLRGFKSFAKPNDGPPRISNRINQDT